MYSIQQSHSHADQAPSAPLREHATVRKRFEPGMGCDEVEAVLQL